MTKTADGGTGSGSDAGDTAKDVAAKDAAAAAKKSSARQKKFWREVVAIVAAAAVLTLVVKAFVVQVYKIPSASMENTLMGSPGWLGDRVLVNKLVYHFRSIARGDIVVFSGEGSWGPDAPPASSNPVVRVFDDVLSAVGLHSGDTFYIKRVIGLPGDHVACCTDGNVTVNGVQLHESGYLYPGSEPSTQPFSITVPAGRLWVMGDNREDSDDSRGHMVGYPGNGTIPENEVVGRAFLIIWPLSRVNDLPIPNTFKQPGLRSDAMAAIASASPASAAGGAGALAAVVAVPLLWRRRSKR